MSSEESEKAELREQVVRQLMEKHVFVTMVETRELYVYADGVYKLGVAEGLINGGVEEALGKEATRYDKNEVVDHIKCRTFQDWKFFDEPVNLVCVGNGVLNLETLELEPHSPDRHFLSKIPVWYVPKEELAKFLSESRVDKFLHEVLPDQKDVDALYEFAGYCLYRKMPLHKAFMLIGEGENGKSTFLNLLKAFLGSENISNQTLQEICQNRFSAVELYGKLANVYADLTQKSLYETGMFKILTGEDSIDGERKFVQRRIKFVSYAKMIYSCNVIPANEKDDTTAFWRRWNLVKFEKRFNKDMGNVDENLLEKLTAKEELSFLLLKSLEGLKRLLANGTFSNHKTTEETRMDYIVSSDPIKYFAETCLAEDVEKFEEKKAVYEAYKTFCKERKLEIKDMNIFSRKLRKHITFTDRQMGKEKTWCYGGITLKGKIQVEQQTLENPPLPEPAP